MRARLATRNGHVGCFSGEGAVLPYDFGSLSDCALDETTIETGADIRFDDFLRGGLDPITHF
jgi:hypothetical protein